MKNVTWLNLDNTPFSDAGVSRLTEMPQLTWLHLGKTRTTDASVAALKKLPKLKYLSVRQSQVSKAGFKQLDDFFYSKGCELVAP